MKYTILLIITISTLACNSNKSSGKKTKDELNKPIKDSVITVLNPKKKSIPKPRYIVAFEDSIKIYEAPSDTSRVLGFINTFEKKEHYAGKAEDIFQSWIPIENYNDTAWVYSHDNISLKLEVDSFNNIVIHHLINFEEICGVCYSYSIVEDIRTNEQIFIGELSRKKSCELNDSIFLINGSNEFILYNMLSKVLVVNPHVCTIELDKEDNSIYALRLQQKQWQFKPSERQYLYEVVKFNYNSNVNKILYTTPHDSLSPFFIAGEDGTGITDFKIMRVLDTLLLSFNLYVEKENPEDEFDPFSNTYHLLVDTLNNFKIEQIN